MCWKFPVENNDDDVHSFDSLFISSSSIWSRVEKSQKCLIKNWFFCHRKTCRNWEILRCQMSMTKVFYMCSLSRTVRTNLWKIFICSSLRFSIKMWWLWWWTHVVHASGIYSVLFCGTAWIRNNLARSKWVSVAPMVSLLCHYCLWRVPMGRVHYRLPDETIHHLHIMIEFEVFTMVSNITSFAYLQNTCEFLLNSLISITQWPSTLTTNSSSKNQQHIRSKTRIWGKLNTFILNLMHISLIAKKKNIQLSRHSHRRIQAKLPCLVRKIYRVHARWKNLVCQPCKTDSRLAKCVANHNEAHLVFGVGCNLLRRTDFIFAHEARAKACQIHEKRTSLLCPDCGNACIHWHAAHHLSPKK